MKHFIQNALGAKKLSLFVLVMLMSITGVQKANAANEIYAALSGSTMTLYFDDQKASRPGVLVAWTTDAGSNDLDDATKSNITKAVIDASMLAARPTMTAYWFYGLENLSSIDGLSNLNTSEVTEMEYMFSSCSSLTSLDLTGFITDNVGYMIAMFEDCSSLTSLDVTGFNTTNVQSMTSMFSNCSSLTSLDLSHFNIANVYDTRNMFRGCENLTTIYCEDDWSSSSVLKYSENMFKDCSNLRGGNGTAYSSDHIDATYARPDGLDSKPGYFTSATTLTPEEQVEVNKVIDLINGIGTVSYTTESKALIDAAREAYNALTDAQKALVPNYATLVAAEQVYEQLKAEAEADQKAANVVIDLIDQIGEVTLASEPAINAARTAYNSLNSIQQELVTNYGTLLAAETTLELLKQQATIDQAMADDVIARIEAIGEVTYTNNCYSRIFDARTAYDALSDVQKALVTNYATLTAAEARYAELEAQAKAVEEAKTQLKALVSEAAELKAVAMLYSPASVEQIDAIIANAQQTINDPYATVEDVNAKTEIIRGEIQFVGAALLEEAKEQLRQSIKALYQSGDYPSWYAAVIIPALNQVDEIMWDNDKTVQENILFFQTTGKAIYDTAKAALEALRASDIREIVSSCEFTGFTDAITVGMMWNEAALNTLVANLNASAATQPYHFIAEECMLTKWDAEYELFVGVDHHEGVVLTPGDYQFVANISIDGEDAAKFRFPKASEATLSVTVDAAVWSVDLAGILIDATYSSAYTTSPTFTLTEGQGFEETQDAQRKTQKIYHNGHFYIIRGEHIYDIQGTLVR